MLDLAGQDVLVLGLGRSGRSAARFCAARGARVVAADERSAAELGAPLPDLPGIHYRVGAPFPDPADFDLCVPSPGVPGARYRERARRAWGDIELASRALSVPIVAVTGTNGKSTTTLMAEAVLRAAGSRARAAGNVGVPALDLVGEPLDVVVLEVSSFQLETTESFRPRVAALLNLAPDHLDRHGSFAAYARAKERVFANQRGEDAAVLNADDPATWERAGRAPARVLPFSTQQALPRGAWLDAGCAVLRDDGPPVRVPLDGLPLRGPADRENALAALLCAFALGADARKGAAGLTCFQGLPHRLEPVGRAGDVRFVNDSKATNPGAALRALGAFSEPLVWIAGGRDKGLDFAPLRDAAARVRVAILFGEAAPALAAALGERVPSERAESLPAAVRRAAERARPGDVVLLSPACASQDQFRDFEERGECFRAAVAALCGAGRRA